jgi:hypothetical protein
LIKWASRSSSTTVSSSLASRINGLVTPYLYLLFSIDL